MLNNLTGARGQSEGEATAELLSTLPIGRRLNPRELILQTLEQFAATRERRGASAQGESA